MIIYITCAGQVTKFENVEEAKKSSDKLKFTK